jgi:general secretion pathway protein D
MQGLDLVKQGQTFKGLESLKRAAELEPRNARFQVDYLGKLRETTSNLLEQAAGHQEAGDLDQASQAYQSVIGLESHNAAALRGLKLIAIERQASTQLAQAERLLQANKTEQVLEITRNVLRESPRNRRAEQLHRAAEDEQESERLARD